ncbi:MAG: hypothetical protein Q8M88_12545 [Phenylobacterium sp.]|uniref:hypothetical protein n=1 Tax=Phenylobacterium sp. TaxID=1871053 RepID=UPI002733A1DB|nr:hypothetical protein [Phenylobacterium sp.]MDP3175252.1 hypothetical protein [Phenylobacterium sp.]
MNKKPKGMLLYGREMEQAYSDYVTAVGQVAYHWNALYEQLGLLFVEVTGTRRKVALGIWYAVQNDRLQGTLLLSALRGREGEDPPWTRHAQADADIAWLVAEVQNSLSDRRNNAIHAPAELHFVVNEARDKRLVPGPIEIGPSFYYGNPRATRLRGKDLIKELEWYAAMAQAYCRFAEAMVGALSTAGSTWPKRPKVPSLGQNLD